MSGDCGRGDGFACLGPKRGKRYLNGRQNLDSTHAIQLAAMPIDLPLTTSASYTPPGNTSRACCWDPNRCRNIHEILQRPSPNTIHHLGVSFTASYQQPERFQEGGRGRHPVVELLHTSHLISAHRTRYKLLESKVGIPGQVTAFMPLFLPYAAPGAF